MTTYHDRFAAALRAALPEGFEVSADRYIATASYGTAALVGYVPDPIDKRKPVEPADVQDWIERERIRLLSAVYHYTPQAAEAVLDLLDALHNHQQAVTA
jgi:hypothetical protein